MPRALLAQADFGCGLAFKRADLPGGVLSKLQLRMLLWTLLLPVGLGLFFTALISAVAALELLARRQTIGTPDFVDLLAITLIVAFGSGIPMVWWLVRNWKNLR